MSAVVSRDDVVRAVRELRQQVTAGSGDWLPFVDAEVVVKLLECCEELLPLLDAVELGEVDQYLMGLDEGRILGRDDALEGVARSLEKGVYDSYDHGEVAAILRSAKSTAGRGVYAEI